MATIWRFEDDFIASTDAIMKETFIRKVDVSSSFFGFASSLLNYESRLCSLLFCLAQVNGATAFFARHCTVFRAKPSQTMQSMRIMQGHKAFPALAFRHLG
jgi:hypothetical protein